ncbi:MAG: GNAT family N-acetyltransferase [Candidatus Eisenbacteria bacterium]
MTRRLPPPPGGLPLPEAGVAGLRVIELGLEHEALLQRFYDANPYYFENITGVPAPPNEAREEILGELPAGWPYTKKWVLGLAATGGELAAQWNVVSDLLAPGVWHIGLFVLATSRHGSGEARAMYDAVENWCVRHGARWLRLGVVKGNDHAERFWRGRGFEYLRERGGIVMGPRTNTVRTFFKPLSGTREEYLALVERDRAESD